MEFNRATRPKRQTPVPPASAQAHHHVAPPSFVKRLKSSKRTTTVILSGALLVSILSIATTALVKHGSLSRQAAQSKESTEIIENLEYQTVVPSGKTIGSLGGWRKVSPPDKPAVYAYTDSINDVAIQVSQQPLPENFIGNVDARVAELAKTYNAQTVIEASGTQAYLGTSAKGPQSVIFTKNNLLIMIKSQKTIPTNAWSVYIKSLN